MLLGPLQARPTRYIARMKVYPNRQDHNRQRSCNNPEDPQLWRDVELILCIRVDKVEDLTAESRLLQLSAIYLRRLRWCLLTAAAEICKKMSVVRVVVCIELFSVRMVLESFCATRLKL